MAEVKSIDTKRAQPTSEMLNPSLAKNQVQDFVSDIKAEIHKIHWSSREELLNYAKIVIVATLVFGFAIYFTDLIIQSILNALGTLVHWIAG